jgi:hypothetical protein
MMVSNRDDHSGYSPVRHLASAIFPFSYKHKYMLMLTAFMDETGHPDDPNSKFVGMAGLLAPSNNWERFEKQWKALLKRYDLPFFHMKDYAHSRKAFEGWKGNETKRRELLAELMQTIRDAHALPFGCTIPMDSYRSYPKHLQITARSPYYWVFIGCVTQLAGLLRPARGFDETIAPVFAEQTEFQNFAMQVFDMARANPIIGNSIDTPVFRPMQKLVPLQAADLVAYEVHKEADRRLYRPKDEPRWAFSELSALAQLNAPNLDMFALQTEADVASYMDISNDALINSITGGAGARKKLNKAADEAKKLPRFAINMSKSTTPPDQIGQDKDSPPKYWRVKWKKND